MGKARRTKLRQRWQAARTRARERGLKAAGVAAAGAGHGLRHFPGVAGPLCVSYGLWLAWAPLGYVALGGFLLWADRRMP
ncbi:hypothetical protein [Streptomyces sp. NPDC018693]|uniref:hypothetical protein n=1 Tax=unclassified Streptomyces TaxID=2593676 RepID=UPI0037A830A0